MSIPEPWSETAFANALAQDNAVTLAAICNGIVCGFITGVYVLDSADIYSVATSEMYRRKGVGGKLLEAFLKALPNEVFTVGLEVRESNSAAISLYEKNGFERVGMRKNFYTTPKENAILMNKKLQK
ncbi:MAG: ribosomal protein S18-alanine N-acetyltransferase, partial [Oscillospiraceae bacterium]